MKCINCGFELNDTDLFCKKCGTKAVKAEDTPKKTFCKFCGKELKENAMFCVGCGKKVEAEAKPIMPEPMPKTPKPVAPAPEPMMTPVQTPVQQPIQNTQPKAKVCPICATPVAPGATYCSGCETYLGEDLSKDESKILCPRCGAELKASQSFCVKCGTTVRLAGAAQEPEAVVYDQTPRQKPQNAAPATKTPAGTAPTAPAKKSGKGLIITLIILLVLVISAATLYILDQQGVINLGIFPKNQVTNNDSYVTPTPRPTPTPAPPKPVKKETDHFAVKEDVTWFDAKNDARDFGGELVSINSKKEFDKVCSLAEEEGIVVFWVGAKRDYNDEWEYTQWLDGEYMTYTKWFKNEPSYYSEEGEDEEYLMVFKVDGEWYFNDAEYDVSKYYSGKIGYIVEIEE